MAPVTLTHVSKSFGAVNVLSDISLDIADGEFVVLVGPSGCGKSTLLRCIAGLEEVTGGEIRIGERVVNNVAPRDRDIAMVFQSYALYPHMDVARNMSFGLILRKEDPAKIEARVGEASGRLGLGALLARLPKQLSGGQRQRVAMGRAIVRKPSVFLFDEPLSNLDAKLRAHMRTEIKALHQQLATTAVYVTHDQIEAMTMASRIVVMNEGLVQQVGPPLELYDRPANLFVAGFIGSPTMNFMEGTIDSAESPAVRLADGELLPVAPGHAGSAGQAVVVGCRPEHMTIGAAGLAGEVRVVEPLGMMTQLMVRLGGNALAVIDLARRPLQPGDRIALAIAPERVHIFDRATGRRLN